MSDDIRKVVLQDLEENIDLKYKAFTKKLSKGVPLLGVRNPIVRSLAQKYLKTYSKDELLYKLPQDPSYEELLIRGVVIAKLKVDIKERLELIKDFLTYLNGWAICDCFCASLKDCKKHPQEYYEFINPLFTDKAHPFYVRFALVMSLDYFCSDDYVDSLVNFIEEIDTTHYYVHMGVAWLMATLYCKCKDKFTPYLHTIKLDSKTYNKGLTKIRESLIPTKEEKAYIKTLKRQD